MTQESSYIFKNQNMRCYEHVISKKVKLYMLADAFV